MPGIRALNRELKELREEILSEMDKRLHRLELSFIPMPTPVDLSKPIPINARKTMDAKWIENVQPIPDVPLGKDIVKQTLTIFEDGVAIYGPVDIAFDLATGKVVGDPPRYWAKVGTTISRQLSYVRSDDATRSVTNDYVQADNYDAPMDSPPNLVDPVQVGESNADERPVG